MYIAGFSGALKILRKEIDRRIEYAAHVRHEPVLATSGRQAEADGDLRFRVLAVDKLVELDTLVVDYDAEYFRPAWANVRSFLVECLGKKPKRWRSFSDIRMKKNLFSKRCVGVFYGWSGSFPAKNAHLAFIRILSILET